MLKRTASGYCVVAERKQITYREQSAFGHPARRRPKAALSVLSVETCPKSPSQLGGGGRRSPPPTIRPPLPGECSSWGSFEKCGGAVGAAPMPLYLCSRLKHAPNPHRSLVAGGGVHPPYPPSARRCPVSVQVGEALKNAAAPSAPPQGRFNCVLG